MPGNTLPRKPLLRRSFCQRQHNNSGNVSNHAPCRYLSKGQPIVLTGGLWINMFKKPNAMQHKRPLKRKLSDNRGSSAGGEGWGASHGNYVSSSTPSSSQCAEEVITQLNIDRPCLSDCTSLSVCPSVYLSICPLLCN